MADASVAAADAVHQGQGAHPFRVALVGNPNTGKTTLFNRLTGLRARTANYPGITVDVRSGTWRTGGGDIDLTDLPGMYSLDGLSPEEKLAGDVLRGASRPDAVAIIIDATSVERSLVLASEVRDLGLPSIVIVTAIDAAHADDRKIDTEQLGKALASHTVAVSARTGEGLCDLESAVLDLKSPGLNILPAEYQSCTAGCSGCQYSARFEWAEKTAAAAVHPPQDLSRPISWWDRLLTHPVVGLGALSVLMVSVFYLIFALAAVPMDLIDAAFSWVGGQVGGCLPTGLPRPLWIVLAAVTSMGVFALAFRTAGAPWSRVRLGIAVGVSVCVSLLPVDDFQSLLVDGVIAGIGGVLIFLPQICILFFCISLLEDSGYLSRAAFVMERLMRFVGMPGKAFVPMLSAHACAIPGIMAARVIDNWRDRLVTILVLPFLTCSARLPVYAMVTALLFPDDPGSAAMAFVFAYLLGIVAALVSAWCLKKTVLKGEAVPLVMELPAYRLPSLRNALLTVMDRATVFVRQAGTVILLISVVLWAMATYPKLPEAEVTSRASVEEQALAWSFAGRAGRLVEPVFAPLGFDWKINVGVMTSFAAREVIVSTLAIVYGLGEDAAEDEATLVETLRRQRRPDGSPVFTRATGLSLLVFFVLAMQCLPTQAVTRRETGSWRWAVFQFVFMTVTAWVAAMVTFQVCSVFAA